jgi:hypothetical protein
MMTNDISNSNFITITVEERTKINMEYLTWLYAKSKDRKKQNNGLLPLDNRRAIELVMRDAGGEKELKQLFLKEHDEKIIDELAKSNLMIAKKLKQDREAVLQALNLFIVDLEK